MAGLEDLYREIILDHYRNPRNRGELPVPPAHRTEGFNPLCGDEIIVYLSINDGMVADMRIAGQGCSISQSSASMMSAAVKGKTVEEARKTIRTFKAMMSIHESTLDTTAVPDDPETPAGVSPKDPGGEEAELQPPSDAELTALGDLAALQGVVRFPVRIKCATLSWNTLAQGLDEINTSA